MPHRLLLRVGYVVCVDLEIGTSIFVGGVRAPPS